MQKNRKISWILTIAFIFSIIFSLPAVPVVAGCQDISGHWAEPQIESLMLQKIINGYPDNTFKPENPISRAEFIVITNKAFNFTSSTAINYSDVKPTDWFAVDIARAKAAGYISGYEDGTMKPNQQISRQEAASIVARILALKPADTTATLQRFSDNKTIANWSRDSIAAMVENSYLKGYPDNSFKPTNSIKRAEAAVLFKIVLDSEQDAFKPESKPKVQSLFDKAGTYGPETGTQVINEDVTISASGVTLQNLIIERDLIIAEEVGDGNVTLNNVTVKGKTYVRGGGKDSIHINGGQYSEIIIEQTATGQVRIVAVDTSGLRVTISENAKGEEIILNGDFKSVTVNADDVNITTQGDTNIRELKVESGLKDVNIELNKDSTVKEIVLNSKTDVEGKGTIEKASGSKAKESSYATQPGSITTPSTSSGSGGGGGGSSTVAVSAITVSPTTMELTVGGGTKTIVATVLPATSTNKNVTWTSSNNGVATVENGVVTPVTAGTTTITAKTVDGGFSKETLVTVKAADLYVLATDADFDGTEDGKFKYIGSAEYVEIPHEIKGISVTSYKEMFEETSVKGVRSTSKNVTNMYSMFRKSQATSLDVSSLDTSNVTDMDSMFYESKATSLDLSSFDTSNVTNMKMMFQESEATSLDLSSFDTSKVFNMSQMFYESKATSLDLSNFNTSNVTKMSFMFWGNKATTLDLSKFDTSNVTTMQAMFRESQATTLDLSSFDTSNVTNMTDMFKLAKATTGYAKTQADADRFNSTDEKPAGLNFMVKDASTVPVSAITVNKSATTLTVGATETITATVEPGDASNKKVTWTSSDNTIATVDANGKVTAVAEGIATITVTSVADSSKKATVGVTVKAETLVSDFVFDASTKTITDYTGTEKSVAIPAKIGEVDVEAIGDNAFANKGLTSVVIPNSVTSIGKHAFIANKLTSVVIPDSVTSIKQGAFSNNELTSINIPNSITTIEKEVFEYNKLTSIVIPDSVTSIGEFAFLANELTSLVIPESVITIKLSAFLENKLTSLIIPNSVKTIEEAAFNNNKLPDAQAFIYARESDGTEDKSKIVSYGGAKRDNVIIPDSVKTIGEAAFAQNELLSITIPNSVTTIEDYAFEDNKLTEVTIPISVTNLGTGAFEANGLEMNTTNSPTGSGTWEIIGEATEWTKKGASPDTIPPVITLNGDATVNVAYGAAYEDAGATANDDVDGDITSSIITTISNDIDAETSFDNTKAATYTYHYNVKDAAGNDAIEVTRTVIVAEQEKVALPIITPSKTSATNREADVTFTVGEVIGVTFYYTLDGTEPTTASEQYTGAVTLTAPDNDAVATINIKVIGIKADAIDSDVATATVTYAAKGVTTYAVTVTNGTGDGDYEVGATVSITANAPATGKVFDKWTSLDGVSFTDANAATTSFTMPAKAVTVEATYKDAPVITYTVTVSNDANGTGTANPATAEAGTEITLSATANSGFQFKEWQVLSGGVTISSDKFTMPAGNVEVKAIFEEIFVPVTDITGVATTGTVGVELILSGTVDPANATNKTITWGLKSGSATLTGDKVIASAAGDIVVTATITNGASESTNYTKDFTITITAVTVPVTDVTLDKSTLNLTAGGATGTLVATVNPTEATNKNVTWTSSDTGVATVVNGVVTPVAAGTATITVKTEDGSFTATSTVTVAAAAVPVTDVTLDKSTLNLTAGGATGTLVATVNPTEATNKNIIWTSSDGSIATVANGVVTPVAAGTATITVTTEDGGKTATCNVTVSASSDTKITLSAIPGVTAPVTGAIPDTTEINEDQYTGTIAWSLDGAAFDTPFAAGKKYTATITLEAKPGYTLAGVTKNFFTVTGATTTNAENDGVVTAVFSTTGTVEKNIKIVGTDDTEYTLNNLPKGLSWDGSILTMNNFKGKYIHQNTLKEITINVVGDANKLTAGNREALLFGSGITIQGTGKLTLESKHPKDSVGGNMTIQEDAKVTINIDKSTERAVSGNVTVKSSGNLEVNTVGGNIVRSSVRVANRIYLEGYGSIKVDLTNEISTESDARIASDIPYIHGKAVVENYKHLYYEKAAYKVVGEWTALHGEYASETNAIKLTYTVPYSVDKLYTSGGNVNSDAFMKMIRQDSIDSAVTMYMNPNFTGEGVTSIDLSTEYDNIIYVKAEIEEDGSTQTKYYKIKIIRDKAGVAEIIADKAALTADSIKGENTDLDNITVALKNPLPSTGAKGSNITWQSNKPEVVSNDGQIVKRPNAGNETVILTATLKKDSLTETKDFVLTVLELEPSTIEFANAGPITKIFGDPAFTNGVSGDGAGAITYSSEDTGVATVDSSSGEVTIVGIGTTVITASKAATTSHATVTNSYTLTVNAKAIEGIDPISGIAKVGEKLTAGSVTPSDATLNYQWLICDTAGGTYANIEEATNSTYTILAENANKFIKVAVTGTGNYSGSVTSDATVAVANAEQAAPTGLEGVAPTSTANSDGKITGTTTEMEYKLSSATEWIKVTATEITGLAAGEYLVRYAAKTGFNAGATADVIVAAYDSTAQDNADIATAKGNIEAGSYTAIQAEAGDASAALTKAQALVGALELVGTTVEVVSGDFTAAIAGTAGNINGTDGYFKFTVKINKGTGTEVVTAEQTMTITATVYVAPPFKGVTGITGVATNGTVNESLALTGTVAPADATNQTIVWTVKSGTATITGTNLTATAAGDVVVTATITNGLTESSDYTQDFTITIAAAGTQADSFTETLADVSATIDTEVTKAELEAGITNLPEGASTNAAAFTPDAKGDVTKDIEITFSDGSKKTVIVTVKVERIKITEVKATSTITAPVFGEQANIHANLPKFTTIEGNPAYLNANNTSNAHWMKKVGDKFETYGSEPFTAGTYIFRSQVRIDGDDALKYKLAFPLKVTVGEDVWLKNGTPSVYDAYSYCMVLSPEYEITAPAYASTNALANTSVTVANGTSEEAAIALLDATVGVAGTEGEIGTATIAWTIADYNGAVAKDYTATGVLALPTGWTGSAGSVTATVTVEAYVDPAAGAKAEVAKITVDALGTITVGDTDSVLEKAQALVGTGYTVSVKTTDGTKISAEGIATEAGEGTISFTVKSEESANTADTEILNITVKAAALGGTVLIDGTLKFGEELTANVELLTGNSDTSTLTYIWKRESETIGENQATYTTVEADIGKTITVEIKSSVETGTIIGTASSIIEKADGLPAPLVESFKTGAPENRIMLKNDGTNFIIKVGTNKTGLQYSTDEGSNWDDLNASGVEIIIPGNSILIRAIETDTHKAGEAAKVILSEGYVFNSNTGTIINYAGTEKDLNIPSSITIDGVDVSVTKIDAEVFKGKGLTSVVIPDTIQSIGYQAFMNNELKSIVIPNSVTFVNTQAFEKNKLIEVTIPDSVTTMGYNVFQNNGTNSDSEDIQGTISEKRGKTWELVDGSNKWTVKE